MVSHEETSPEKGQNASAQDAKSRKTKSNAKSLAKPIPAKTLAIKKTREKHIKAFSKKTAFNEKKTGRNLSFRKTHPKEPD